MTTFIAQSDIDNALVAMKDRIYQVLYRDDVTAYKNDKLCIVNLDETYQILSALWYAEDLWIVNRYQYKAIEILNVIRSALYVALEDLHHRATSKREKLEVLIRFVDELLRVYKS